MKFILVVLGKQSRIAQGPVIRAIGYGNHLQGPSLGVIDF